MTIVNLKPFLYGFITYKNIYSTFKGQTVGVDLSVFVHRYFGWANVIDDFMEERFDTLCKVLVSTFKSMESQGITPLLVFDGGELPAKNLTKQQRQNCVDDAVENYNQLMQKHAQEPFKTHADPEFETNRNNWARKCLHRTPEMMTAPKIEFENAGAL